MCVCSISACAYVFNPLSRLSPVLSLSPPPPLSLSHTHTSILQQHNHIKIDSKRTTHNQVKVIYRRMKTAKGGKKYERVVGGGGGGSDAVLPPR